MGPLTGFRIVEFAGIGPGPMAAMLFADLGASIIRLDRLTPSGLGIDKPARFELIARSRPSVAVDLKHPDGLALAVLYPRFFLFLFLICPINQSCF